MHPVLKIIWALSSWSRSWRSSSRILWRAPSYRISSTVMWVQALILGRQHKEPRMPGAQTMGAALTIPDARRVGSKRPLRQPASTVPCGMLSENEFKETRQQASWKADTRGNPKPYHLSDAARVGISSLSPTNVSPFPRPQPLAESSRLDTVAASLVSHSRHYHAVVDVWIWFTFDYQHSCEPAFGPRECVINDRVVAGHL